MDKPLTKIELTCIALMVVMPSTVFTALVWVLSDLGAI